MHELCVAYMYVHVLRIIISFVSQYKLSSVGLLRTTPNVGAASRKHMMRHRIPYSNSTSSSDELSENEMSKKTASQRKRVKKTNEKEDIQDTLKEMKQILHVLCEKVEQNEKCLKELKTHSR